MIIGKYTISEWMCITDPKKNYTGYAVNIWCKKINNHKIYSDKYYIYITKISAQRFVISFESFYNCEIYKKMILIFSNLEKDFREIFYDCDTAKEAVDYYLIKFNKLKLFL